MRAIERWHEIVKSRNVDDLDSLLADDVVFHSPVVHTPQRGRAVTKVYLSAAVKVLGNESFRYVREVVSGDSAVLEFVTQVGDTQINGVDMIRWNADDRICDFKVMIRPLRAIQLVHQMMAAQLPAA